MPRHLYSPVRSPFWRVTVQFRSADRCSGTYSTVSLFGGSINVQFRSADRCSGTYSTVSVGRPNGPTKDNPLYPRLLVRGYTGSEEGEQDLYEPGQPAELVTWELSWKSSKGSELDSEVESAYIQELDLRIQFGRNGVRTSVRPLGCPPERRGSTG